MQVNIKNKSFGAKTILSNFCQKFNLGDVVYISGENGTGKTTLLNILSGLDKNFDGQLNFDFIPKISYMFQEATLLPWLSVAKNISISQCGDWLNSRQEQLEQISDKLKIYKYLNHLSSTLSGGLQKRVNLARALAKSPNILILDEPFANLDQESKKIILQLLKEIKESKNMLIIITEHNRTLVENLVDVEVKLG